MKKLKPPLTYAEQVELYKSRGLIVKNEADALQKLQSLNYYRISGYAFLFQDPQTNTFINGVSFEYIMSLYRFDEQLRRLLYKYLEHIEIHFRTQVAYQYSHYFKDKYLDNDAHYHGECYKHAGFCAEFTQKLEVSKSKNNNSAFVKKHKDTYGGYMPLWVIAEILTFADISTFYTTIPDDIQRNIAQEYGANAEYLTNWMHVLVVLRNTCAHYGRLYGNKIKPPVKLGERASKKYKEICNDELYAAIRLIHLLYSRCFHNNAFLDEFEALIESHRGVIELSRMGIPKNWRAHFTEWREHI